LIVDQYKTPDHQTILVAQSTTAGMDSAIDDWSEIILDIFKPDAFIARGDSSIRTLEGVKPFKKIFKGHEGKLQSEGALIEYDVLYAADFLNGQKTGFFLDQRENRKHLKDHARGKRVLDLCCYSGGWGLAALKGGANHVTFVDQSADALNLVHRGLKLNGFSTDAPTVNLIEADIFEYLEKSRDYFDIVVSDPPAFVKSKKNLPQAIKAYQKLNSLALKRINPEGGLLYTCSCSYHLSEEEFLKIVANSVRWHGNAGKVILSSGQGLDHPWIINRPESRYLKCACIQI
jgi:23S rRNA (cytosine1962-C5)-methyltransferase